MRTRGPRAEIGALLDAWPHIMREASDPWASDFAMSIWRQSGEPRWAPTLKQLRVMRRLARELNCTKGANR